MEFRRDALIGCFDAKYTYWLIRPPQADPAITLPIGLPPHPSYPSAHSCVSGSSTEVLAAMFPSERSMLEAFVYSALFDGDDTMLVGLTGDYDIEDEITGR